jgi:tRNA ligase
LIVTSKHSLGDEKNNVLHAIKGNEWLDRCLAKVHKRRSDFAKVLWTNRWTAVAELCDDSFEEHVLAYAPEETGLHLHGINKNSRLLSSLPPDQVADIAKEFGFIQTEYLVMNSIEEVKTFTDACSKDDGRWNGKHVEGFVVRSHDVPFESSQSLSGDTFMFKVKFEQPYLRWRDWREITRRMLTYERKQGDQDDGTLLGVRQNKLKHPDTKAYANWVAAEIKRDPKSFDCWAQSRGIVATRERFLKWYEQNGAPEKEAAEPAKKTRDTCDRVLLIPIAVPGCGTCTTGIEGRPHVGQAKL